MIHDISRDETNARRALKRAQKRYEHAEASLRAAESESARKRHSRRLHNAQRHIRDCYRAFGAMMCAAD